MKVLQHGLICINLQKINNMKKFLILTIFSLMTVANVMAQTSNESVTLTVEQYNNLPSDIRNSIENEKTIKTVGKWAGLGKEIGEGVNSALMAIEGSATRISDTAIGKTAINIVVWKFIGKDVMQIVVGLIVLLIGVPIMVRLINVYKPHRILIKKHFIKEKMQFEKEYKYDSGDGESVAVCYGGLIAIIILSCLIMFL